MDFAATVVITAYNQERFIHRAIGDVLAQTVPCEVIVTDDGSTDDTVRRALRLLGPGRRGDLVELGHTGGPARGRNVGIAAASAPFVAFLDADDRIAPEKVERQIAALTDSLADWALCDTLIEGWRGEGDTPLVARGRAGWLGADLEAYNFIPTAAPLLRTSLAREVQFREDHPDDWDAYPEDWLYWKAIAARALAAYVPEVLATYSWTENGRSGRLGRDGAHYRKRARRG